MLPSSIRSSIHLFIHKGSIRETETKGNSAYSCALHCHSGKLDCSITSCFFSQVAFGFNDAVGHSVFNKNTLKAANINCLTAPLKEMSSCCSVLHKKSLFAWFPFKHEFYMGYFCTRSALASVTQQVTSIAMNKILLSMMHLLNYFSEQLEVCTKLTRSSVFGALPTCKFSHLTPWTMLAES